MDEKKELGYYDGLIFTGLPLEELEEEINWMIGHLCRGGFLLGGKYLLSITR